MTITYEPRLALPQWGAGSDPFNRGQMDDAFAKLGNLAGRGEQGPLSQLPAPGTPTTTTATTGGTLAPATYAYRITALSPAGGSFAAGETTPSGEVTRIVPAGTSTNTVTVNWTAVPGATGYRIYGRTAGAELLLATVGAVTTWTDTGAGAPAGALPATNTTSGRPAPGIRNRTYWATDDRGGRYSYDDGTNWYDLGPSPVTGPVTGATALIVGHASAATSDAVLIARGKTGQTGDLLKLQDPTATTDYLRVSSAGALVANAGATVRPASTSAVGLVVNGLTSQTGDLLSAQVNGTPVATVAASGALTTSNDVFARYTTGNQVRTGTVGSGAAAGLEIGTDLRNWFGLTAADLWSFHIGGAERIQYDWRASGSAAMKITSGDLQLADTASGRLFAVGTDHYIGPNALGSAGARLHLAASGSGGADTFVQAESSGSDAHLNLRQKGAGLFRWQTSGGTTLATLDSSGQIQAAGAVHYLGVSALGATGGRLKIVTSTIGSNGTLVKAEDQGGTEDILMLGSSGAVTVLNNNVQLGTASSSNATSGFPWIPALGGAPTGAVTTVSGIFGVPLTYDTANRKLWVRDGGVWRGVVLT